MGTAENYQWALNSFQKILGRVDGFMVDKNVIRKWVDGMKNGIMIDGKLVGKIADATCGMYLRTCRVVWNLELGQTAVMHLGKTLVCHKSENSRSRGTLLNQIGLYLAVFQSIYICLLMDFGSPLISSLYLQLFQCYPSGKISVYL